LRRRFSAGLSLRLFGFVFVPGRASLPPAVAAAARRRTGARLRASYQMNIPIAAIRTSAPVAIAIALVPLNVLLPEVGVWVVGAATVGVTVCVCGAGVDGVSGVSGLP
jgi:hypothetical protein